MLVTELYDQELERACSITCGTFWDRCQWGEPCTGDALRVMPVKFVHFEDSGCFGRMLAREDKFSNEVVKLEFNMTYADALEDYSWRNTIRHELAHAIDVISDPYQKPLREHGIRWLKIDQLLGGAGFDWRYEIPYHRAPLQILNKYKISEAETIVFSSGTATVT